MRIGLKILIPQMMLLLLLALLCLFLVIDTARRQESIRATRTQYQDATRFANRLGKFYTENAVDILSYALDHRRTRLAAIAERDLEAQRGFATYLSATDDERERALLTGVLEARAWLIGSRNRLISSIDSGNDIDVRGSIERWQIHLDVLTAHIDDLNAFTLTRLRRTLTEAEDLSLQVIYATIAGLLAATLLVMATYYYMRGSLSQPLASLTRRIEDFGRGKVDVRVDPLNYGRNDEIGTLAATFNRMAGQIEDLNRSLEKRVVERTAQLEAANKELEAFSYSASHDLRAPLQTIDGFSRALEEDYADKLDAEGKDFLSRVRKAAQRMAQLIDDLLKLSRISRAELTQAPVDLSALAEAVAAELRERDPARAVAMEIAPGIQAQGDPRLLRVMLENLFGNAWKFTSGRPEARIEFGVTEREGDTVYFIRDNGAGFDMGHAAKLFMPFQRLHSATAFPGTGIGLATVRRIVQRHGGRIWAESSVGQGATFHFTLSGGSQ